MNRCKFALTMGGALAMGLAGVANADEDLRSEVAQLRQQVAELKGQNDSNWLNERRAEEVKGLIQEVLADADTRASLMADGVGAGHDGRNFYMASMDGGFRLNVGGQIQFRYILNLENADDGEEGVDNSDSGFQLRRVKLAFNGHVTAGRKWDYEVVLAHSGDEDQADTFLEDAKFGTALSENLRVDAGKFKLPYSREELVSSRRSLAVERSIVGDFFTLDRAEQIQLSYKTDQLLVRGSFSDGHNSEFTDIGDDEVCFALTGRVDFKVMGDWEQAADSTAWAGPNGLFLGGAVHYQLGDDDNGNDEDMLAWTVDALFETNGLGIMGAFFGAHFDDHTGGADTDTYGATLEVSYLVNNNLQPFIRGEWADTEDLDGEDCNIFLTAGFNYYFKGHDAKLTIDVLWVVDSADITTNLGTGAGFSSSPDVHGQDNVLIRLQFQLLF